MRRYALVATLLAVVMTAKGTEKKSIWPPFTPTKNAYAHRLVTENFRIVRNMREIDRAVLAEFHKIVPQREIAVGNQAFAETDISEGRHRRFDFAGQGGDLWFIVYEVGGRAYHQSVIVFQKNGARWQRVASAAGFPLGNDFTSFVKAVKRNRFDEVSDRDNL